jgi:hypothetical protein
MASSSSDKYPGGPLGAPIKTMGEILQTCINMPSLNMRWFSEWEIKALAPKKIKIHNSENS